MAHLNEEMKAMIASQQCFIATADGEGRPSIAPKGSTRVLDDSTLVFSEATGKVTYNNLKANNKVAIAVLDREKHDGYRFSGRAEMVVTGELFEQATAAMAKMNRPAPLAVVKVHIEEIYSLKPGKVGPIE